MMKVFTKQAGVKIYSKGLGTRFLRLLILFLIYGICFRGVVG